MKYIIHKPYIIFWSLIPILLIYGFSFGEKTMDINVHDTYFVISITHVFNLISLFFVVIGLVYYTINKLNTKRRPLLTIIHLLGTLGGIFILLLLPLLFPSESDWYSEEFKNGAIKENLLITQLVIFTIILIVQPLLLFHLMISFFNKISK
ncbi:hypothetical protein [Aquimarina sp. SS2-1]|uniref:hypothetical protein n=1 Tax=Aquimarina besae TaxID=3342247 RepID=UPI00366F1EEA